MRKIFLTTILALVLSAALSPCLFAGDLPVNDVDVIRKLLVQPDVDLSIFDGEELCDALIEIIENYDGDYRERYIHGAVCWLYVTEDERSVEYLIDYLDDHPMDCLYGLGHFSTEKSYNALAGYLDDEDEFNRRFAADSLGMLDYTVSDEMWELRDDAVALLNGRLELEEEDWILPLIEESIAAIASQQLDEGTQILSE